MNLRSTIYRGEITHERLGETPHTFIYPATFFGLDLSELDHISKEVSLFGHNEFRPLSLQDKDYLHGENQPIADQLEQILPPAKAMEHTILISSPRYFGYAFNPVNFHLRMVGPRLISVVAEVNNTFGDRHVYPLTQLTTSAESTWTATCPKNFHVSPFNNMEGEYHFTFRITDKEIFLGIDLHRDGACILKTWIQGKSKQLSNASIWRYALLHPFDTALNSMPRILWQAAILYYKKELKLHKRPEPQSTNTLINRDNPDKKRSVI